jgi:hypothetical protein
LYFVQEIDVVVEVEAFEVLSLEYPYRLLEDDTLATSAFLLAVFDNGALKGLSPGHGTFSLKR